MTSKKLSIIMIIFLVLFCVIFGVSATLKQKELDRLDKEHDRQVQEQMDKQNQDTANDVSTTQKNENANNAGNTTSSGNTQVTGGVVNFSDFVSMYAYAENKLNKSTNIHSVGSGGGYLNASTSMPGISLNNEVFTLDYVRAQNLNQTYFNFHVIGNFLDGLADFDYESGFYTEGANSYYHTRGFEGSKWTAMSKQSLKEKYSWEPNKTFLTVNANAIQSSTLFYDKTKGVYTGTAVLKPEIACVNKKYTLQTAIESLNPCDFSSCKITVVCDKYGNFKSIRYQEIFKANVYQKEFNSTMYATMNVDYTETFIVTGNGSVQINKPNIKL